MRTIKEQIQDWCKHFNGVHSGCCKAGVNYDDFKGLPCIRSLKRGSCSKREWLTEEEVNIQVAAHEKRTSEFMKTVPIINRVKREHKGQNWRGVEECPVCKGKLHLSHSSYNGHVHGRCETKDCLSWME